MRAYVCWAGADDPKETHAVLVFAGTAREARKVGWHALQGFEWTYWTDVRVLWIKDGADYHAIDGRTEPYAIDDPDSCVICDLWWADGYVNMGGDLVCHGCADDIEFENAAALPTEDTDA